jgi:TfoX/Sxy family transcriptional regulator of competence genes
MMRRRTWTVSQARHDSAFAGRRFGIGPVGPADATPNQPLAQRCLSGAARPVIADAAALARSEGGHRLARLADVAYDTELADRIRFLIGTGPGVTEKKMFGGLAFLVGGNMAISASGRGGALVRVDPDESSALIAMGPATEAVMGGRAMPGWLRVSAENLETDRQLTEWVSRAVAYARSLPPKR